MRLTDRALSCLQAAALTVLFAVASIWAAHSVSAADGAPRIQIIVDGSGSMWGKLPGDSGAKYAVVREALRMSLPRISKSVEVGLALYGHRRRGDCSDVELSQSPQPVDTARITGPLEKLNPKGRGPLALAMVAAADALPLPPGRDSLILIHDDPDNCQGDPCAVARDLHRVRPRLVIHTISLGMKAEDVALMSCVASITGGRSFDVQDAPSAANAIGEALQLASLQGPELAKRPSGPAATPEPPKPETGPPGLRLTASLATGTPVIDKPVQFRVFREGEASEPLAEVTEAAPNLALAPGKYSVEATLGHATARQTIEVVPDRPTRATIVLDAGAITLSSAAAGGVGLAPTAVFSIAIHNERDAGKGRVLWLGPAQDLELVVPSGTYRVTVQDRQYRAEHIVKVQAGSRDKSPLTASAGRLRLRAHDFGAADRPAENVLFMVLEDDPSAPDGRREVARSTASEPLLLLPAGTYHVIARKGTAEARELVALKGGDEARRTLLLRIGRALLTTRVPAALGAAADSVSYRVFRLDQGEQLVARTDQSGAALQLPAGRYRIEAAIGRLNGLVSREIDVKEGLDQEVVFEPLVAGLQLRLVSSANGLNAADVFWEVLDGSGRPVWRSMEAEPRGVLAAGRYTVRAETRDRRIDRTVDLRPGEQRALEIGPE